METRSHIVHLAKLQVSNRFQLIHLAAAITRKFHKPSAQCVSTSITESLEMIADKGESTMYSGSYIADLERQSQVFDPPEDDLEGDEEEVESPELD